MIPKILHRVVPERVPDRFEGFWRRFRELHPGWELRTWQDPLDPTQFELGHKFAECTSGAQLAGLVRVEILWRFGGVYVDMDIEPLRPLDPLLAGPAFVGTENGVVLTDALMAAVPGHPGFGDCVTRLQHTPMSAGALATGPLLVTSVLSGRDDVLVLPPRFFYPAKFQGLQEERERIVAEGRSYAIHHWHRSWNGPRMLDLGEGRERVRRIAHHLQHRSRRRARNSLVRARQRWDRLAPSQPSPRVQAHSEGRLLLTTDDGLLLLVPAEPGRLGAEVLLTGQPRPGLASIIGEFVEAADVVVVTGDDLGYATVAAARRVGPHGTVITHRAGPLVRENLQLHRYDAPNGRVVSVRDAAELRALAATPRRSLRPALIIGSSEPESLDFLEELTEDLRLVGAVVIDIPARQSGGPHGRLDELLSTLADGRSVRVAQPNGELEPASIDEVLVARGFETVVLPVGEREPR